MKMIKTLKHTYKNEASSSIVNKDSIPIWIRVVIRAAPLVNWSIIITNLFQNRIEQTRELRMQLDLFKMHI